MTSHHHILGLAFRAALVGSALLLAAKSAGLAEGQGAIDPDQAIVLDGSTAAEDIFIVALKNDGLSREPTGWPPDEGSRPGILGGARSFLVVMSEKVESHRHFLPAAGRDLFLPLYDPLTKLLGADRARQALIDQANLAPGQRVLDVGCGTGTLVLQIRRSFPGAETVGLDPDPKALARAWRKAERQGAAVRFDEGFADALPYPDASFDRVFSSMMFHHVESDDKVKMLREVRRVLRPGGSFHLMDFVGPEASDGFFACLLHSHARLKDNSETRILEWMRQAGFGDPVRAGSGRLLLGRLAYYRAGRETNVLS